MWEKSGERSQMSKLKLDYIEKIRPELKKELNISNIHAVPKIEKVTVSAKTGSVKEDSNAIEEIKKVLSEITGQNPKLNKSKKAVSSFKLRIGQPVGLTVTLRNEKMYDFLSRLLNVALPRLRDFKGLPKKAFDGNGNYSIGIEEHVIMPESKYEGNTRVFGFQVNITTTAKDDKSAEHLLNKLGFKFEKDN